MPDKIPEHDQPEWGGWKIVSKMLDNPDPNGIYPTSQCYKELYDFVISQKAEAFENGRKQGVSETKREIVGIIGRHNARILNQYQLLGLGNENVLFQPIENATKETLDDLIKEIEK